MTLEERELAAKTGTVPRRDIDTNYYHLSAPDQVLATANLHFQDCDTLIELSFPIAALEPHLKWELAPKRGSLFPHYYAELLWQDACAEVQLERVDGKWVRA